MGKDSPDPPKPVQVDPRETAAEQFEFGKKSALYNKQLAESTFQQTPYGSLRYEQVSPNSRRHGGSGIPTTRMIQELNPADQRLLDQQRALKGQYGDVAGSLVSKLGEFPTANEATRQSQLGSILERFQPQQSRDRSALETQLANQGFVRGSEAWNSAMDQVNRRENDFRLAANLQAGGEMRADIAQQMQAKNQALQGISTYMTGASPAAMRFAPVSSPQVSTPDYAGLAATNAQMQNQANMAAYNAQMQNQSSGLSSLLGTAAGLGSAYLMGPVGGGTSTFGGFIPGAASGGGWSFG